VQLLRPRQWIKNLLVFAAPAAAGVLDEREHLVHSAVVFAAFCLAASGTYCLNDAADADADRLHPHKRHRPVAAGLVAPSSARALGVVLLAAGIALAALSGEGAAAAVVACYVVLTTAYTYRLKHIAVIDIVVVSAGFVLRAVAGVVGTEVPISDWYLIVASFGSLFLVAGKRAAELSLEDATGHRRSLEDYSESFLLLVQAVALGVTLMAYCLWAFEKSDLAGSWFPWFEASIVPFTALLLRYALAHRTGRYTSIEDVVLRDRHLQAIAVVWVACLAAGVYVVGTPPLST